MPKLSRVSDLLHATSGKPAAPQIQAEQSLVTEHTPTAQHRSVQKAHARVQAATSSAQMCAEESASPRVQTEVDAAVVKKVSQHGVSTTLASVHATVAGVADIEMTPPHPPREDTPMYMRTHHHLIVTQDRPCIVCGVRKSTLGDPKQNPFGAKDLETHHHPLERCLLDACDPEKVGRAFPQVKDRVTLEEFVDSEANMLVLCDIHHRHPLYGIHHVVGPDFFAQPFVYDGYQIMTDKEHEAEVAALDEKIVEAHLTAQEIAFGEGTAAQRSKAATHSSK